MIKEVVGIKVYNVWLDMIKRLVPNGRTHRLSVIISGMLQYASEISHEKESPKAKKLTDLFEAVSDYSDDENIDPAIEITEKLLDDAGVSYKRKSSRGDSYSIAEEAVREFLAWENMPWES